MLRTEVLPKLTYQITNGADLTYTIGSGKDVTITCDGALSDFTGVKIDGVTLPSSQYTVKEGSTIVTLPGDTLNTLAPGSHTITLVYQYGDVSTTLTVKAADTSDGGEEDKPDTKPDTNPDASRTPPRIQLPAQPGYDSQIQSPTGIVMRPTTQTAAHRTPYRKQALPARPYGGCSDWIVGSGSGRFAPGGCEKRKRLIKSPIASIKKGAG